MFSLTTHSLVAHEMMASGLPAGRARGRQRRLGAGRVGRRWSSSPRARPDAIADALERLLDDRAAAAAMARAGARVRGGAHVGARRRPGRDGAARVPRAAPRGRRGLIQTKTTPRSDADAPPDRHPSTAAGGEVEGPPHPGPSGRPRSPLPHVPAVAHAGAAGPRPRRRQHHGQSPTRRARRRPRAGAARRRRDGAPRRRGRAPAGPRTPRASAAPPPRAGRRRRRSPP